MTCDQARQLLPDHWAQTLSPADELALEAHLADCPVCHRESARLHGLWRDLARLPQEEPDNTLRSRFYDALGAYREGAESRKQRWWPLAPAWQIAAGFALLAAGLTAGYSMRPSGTDGEIAELRQEVSSMRQMVALSLLQQQSASERLRGVSWAYQAEPSDTEILTALVNAVNHDSNVNVRLAAVDALHTFSNSPTTRKAVLESLPRQNTPLVQVALIDLLVELKERQAAAELERLAQDVAVDDGVKQRARWALENLQ